MSKSNPIVLRLLPDRSHGPREVALAESADRDADQTRPQIGLPKHRRAAGRQEMVSDLSAFGSITHIGVVGASCRVLWPFRVRQIVAPLRQPGAQRRIACEPRRRGVRGTRIAEITPAGPPSV